MIADSQTGSCSVPEPATWWYELDADDRVAAVGGERASFPWRDGAPHAFPSSALGQPLSACVGTIELAHVLRRIVGGVRKAGAAVEVPFRCDSATAERHLQFRAASLAGGRVRVTTRLLFEVPLHGPADAPPEPGNDAMISMCSWCSHIRMPDGTWLAPAEAAARLGMFCGTRMPAITHGLCGGCLTVMQPLFDDDVPVEGAMRAARRG